MSPDFGELFDLRADQEAPAAIDEQIRGGVRFEGTNLWVLFFAVLVASVGLNVNSTAVIIGAMLISPLMGPIVGIGYGAAIDDTALMARAAKNLAIFTALSLLTSTAYFALSPLNEPGSELLARTTPNLWDVLIASFGGAAGMVGATRRGFTNVVPGVAIATALMPPLCTVGFGIAHARWDMSGGAFYLFVINGVFIAASTLAVSRVLRLPRRVQVDGSKARRQQLVITLGLLAVLVPAVWLGVQFVQQELFASQARAVVRALQSEANSNIVASNVLATSRRLDLTVIGGAAAQQNAQARAELLLAQRGVTRFEVTTRLVGSVPDAAELRRQVGNDVAMSMTQRLAELETRVHLLQDREAAAKATAEAPVPDRAAPVDAPALLAEVRALEPTVEALTVLSGPLARAGSEPPVETTVVVIEVTRTLPSSSRLRLHDWLRQRVAIADVGLFEQVAVARK